MAMKVCKFCVSSVENTLNLIQIYIIITKYIVVRNVIRKHITIQKKEGLQVPGL